MQDERVESAAGGGEMRLVLRTVSHTRSCCVEMHENPGGGGLRTLKMRILMRFAGVDVVTTSPSPSAARPGLREAGEQRGELLALGRREVGKGALDGSAAVVEQG